MTSTRLPGKVLLQAAGKSMLTHQLERLQRSDLRVIVATTNNDSDDPIVRATQDLDTEYYRGSEDDVLSRFSEAARKFNLDIVVRVTSDCPLIDGELVRQSVETYLSENDSFLFLSNTLVRSYPRGFDFEVFSVARLFEANDAAVSAHQREHVTPWIYESPTSRVQQVRRGTDASDLRVTLDTSADLELIVKLIDHYGASSLDVEQIIEILRANPELVALNAHVEQKKLNE